MYMTCMIQEYMYNRISQTKSKIHVPLDLGYSLITIKLSHLTQIDDQNKENNHNKQKDAFCLDCLVTRGNQYTVTLVIQFCRLNEQNNFRTFLMNNAVPLITSY